MTNLFFPLIILLALWRYGVMALWRYGVMALWKTVFGLFLRWRTAPRSVKKLFYFVHAQPVAGVSMGVFAWLGHVLIDQQGQKYDLIYTFTF